MTVGHLLQRLALSAPPIVSEKEFVEETFLGEDLRRTLHFAQHGLDQTFGKHTAQYNNVGSVLLGRVLLLVPTNAIRQQISQLFGVEGLVADEQDP